MITEDIMEVKICTKCGEEKNICEFRRCFYKTNNKVYYKSMCKNCEGEYNKCRGEYWKKYYEDNKDCIKERAKQWRKDNIERAREIDRQCCRRHKEEWRERNRRKRKRYLENNRKKVYARNERWRRANLDKKNAVGVRRNAKKLNQTPFDANKKKINYMYHVAHKMTEEYSIEYQVDHIEPLSKGGLHHEDNLQILSKALNLEKASRWPLTKEEEILYVGITIKDLKSRGEIE